MFSLELVKMGSFTLVLLLLWPAVDSLIHPDSMLPLYKEEGGKAILKCTFSQTGNTQLKWWKDNHNFYTHEKGVGVTNPGAGISLGNLQIKNNGQIIIISNITKASSGWYKCVVTLTDYTATEEDLSRSPFTIDILAKRLHVVRLPQSPPVIRGTVSEGILTLMCQGETSSPPVTLKWYKDGKSVPEYKVSQDSGIISRLTLPLDQEEDFINLVCTATVEVKCEEEIGRQLMTSSEEVYWRKASVTVSKNGIRQISSSSVQRIICTYCLLLCALVFSCYLN